MSIELRLGRTGRIEFEVARGWAYFRIGDWACSAERSLGRWWFLAGDREYVW